MSDGRRFIVCFMEIGMDEMLSGVSMQSQEGGTTFCNIYTKTGVALSNTVLGGLAMEDSLLDAMKNAAYEDGYSYQTFLSRFQSGERGVVSFSYNGIRETLAFVPVAGTDWMLTYLIRESVISGQFSSISREIIVRSVIQSALTVLILTAIFAFLIKQMRRNAKLRLERETSEAANLVKRQELEQRLALQEKLLAEEKQRTEQDQLITAMASDYRSVYLVNLDEDEAICYFDDRRFPEAPTSGQHFPYLRDFTEFAYNHVAESYREGYLQFIQPENIRRELQKRQMISYRFLELSEGGESYCMLRMAGVRHLEDRDDHRVHAVGVGFTDMDASFIPRIFDAFTQEDNSRNNKFGSTGLVMAITKNIVELMNGTISVQSEKGAGSEFTVVITLTNSDHQGSASLYLNPGDLRILVVDDEEIAAEHARIVLEEIGVKADTCLTGQAALHILEVAHAKHMPYHLVLLDWKMPEMDSIEVAKEIRKRYDKETTVIILTAFNWDDILDEALHTGVDSFLAKPLFASHVIEEFERIARRNNMSLYKEKKRAELKDRHILMAEDVFINAEITKQIVTARGAEISHAKNGKIAVEMFKDSPLWHYDAILMDVRMPEMDGLEATAAIRAMERPDAKAIPIIAMTANAFDEDVQLSLQAGMNAHLSKPVEPEHLYQTLEELIWEADQVKNRAVRQGANTSE